MINRETGYEASYSAARWPSGTTKLLECNLNDDLCMEKYRKNAAMIQVFYEELNYETLIENPAYTVNKQSRLKKPTFDFLVWKFISRFGWCIWFVDREFGGEYC